MSSTFAVGMRVEVHGLKITTEDNGKIGIIIDSFTEDGVLYYVVDLGKDEDREIEVPGKNLRLVKPKPAKARPAAKPRPAPPRRRRRKLIRRKLSTPPKKKKKVIPESIRKLQQQIRRRKRSADIESSDPCMPSHLKKYTNPKRKSPPIPANDCPVGTVERGNDGRDYIVKSYTSKDKLIHRWFVLKKQPTLNQMIPPQSQPDVVELYPCLPSTLKRYTNRKTLPPIPANECELGTVKTGNDGKEYIVRTSKNKQDMSIHRWYVLKKKSTTPRPTRRSPTPPPLRKAALWVKDDQGHMRRREEGERTYYGAIEAIEARAKARESLERVRALARRIRGSPSPLPF